MKNQWAVEGKWGRCKVAGKATFVTIVVEGHRGPMYIEAVSFGEIDGSRYREGDFVTVSGKVEMRKGTDNHWHPQLVAESVSMEGDALGGTGEDTSNPEDDLIPF